METCKPFEGNCFHIKVKRKHSEEKKNTSFPLKYTTGCYEMLTILYTLFPPKCEKLTIQYKVKILQINIIFALTFNTNVFPTEKSAYLPTTERGEKTVKKFFVII